MKAFLRKHVVGIQIFWAFAFGTVASGNGSPYLPEWFHTVFLILLPFSLIGLCNRIKEEYARRERQAKTTTVMSDPATQQRIILKKP